jgi:hypothetical protein
MKERKAMVPFLLLIGLIGILIVCGVCISVYLYKQGVIRNTSFESFQSYQTGINECDPLI